MGRESSRTSAARPSGAQAAQGWLRERPSPASSGRATSQPCCRPRAAGGEGRGKDPLLPSSTLPSASLGRRGSQFLLRGDSFIKADLDTGSSKVAQQRVAELRLHRGAQAPLRVAIKTRFLGQLLKFSTASIRLPDPSFSRERVHSQSDWNLSFSLLLSSCFPRPLLTILLCFMFFIQPVFLVLSWPYCRKPVSQTCVVATTCNPACLSLYFT